MHVIIVINAMLALCDSTMSHTPCYPLTFRIQILSNLPKKCDINFMTVIDDLKFFEQIQMDRCFNVRVDYSHSKF